MSAIFFIAGLFFYFLPSIIAMHKRNAAGIVLLNLFLGWTFIGWVVAFIWALAAEREIPEVRILPVSPVSQFCSACGVPVAAGQRFCHACGSGLVWQPGAQNRLSAPPQLQR